MAAATPTPTKQSLEEAAVAAALQARGISQPVQGLTTAAPGPTVTIPASEKAKKRRPSEGDAKDAKPVYLTAEQEAMEIARQMRGEELRRRGDRLAQRRDSQGRRLPAEPTPRPRNLYRRRAMPDDTIVLDSQGQPLPARAGFIRRWVRMHDHEGRPVARRLADWVSYGAERLVDPHTKQPIEGMYGAAIECPVEGYADRMLNKAPDGAYDRNVLLHGTREMAREINARAGDEVAYLYEGKEHGSRRQSHYDAELTDAMTRTGDEEDE